MQDTKDVSVFILLFQIQHLSRYHAMKRLEELELKPGQAGILFTLNVEGVLSQRQLAEKIGITPPSMTVALRKLEELGYVRKEPDGRDQRIIRIRLSEKGKECVEDLKKVMGDMEEIIYQGMSREERLLLKRLLLEMRKSMMDSKDFKGMDMCSIMEKTRPSKGPNDF